MEYLDFDLHLSQRTGDGYTVTVTHSPVGEARTTLQFPLDDAALERQLKSLEIALMRSGSVRRGVTMTDTDAASVSGFGRQLFGALFAGDVAVALRRSQDHVREKRKGLRLRLRIDDPLLAALPWEFAYDPERGDYVCLSMETPLVRYLDSGRPIETLAVQPPLTVLAMVASPTDRAGLDVDAEIERVRRATASLVETGRLHVEWMQGAGWRDLQRTLRRGDYHVFHFIGHGHFDEAAGEGTLSFVGENGRAQTLNATEIGSLLADERALRLVVLNSCLGAKGNAASVFSSTAATLVRRGVPAVVAMQYEISDRAALEFSQSLYEAIADGMPVDAAVAEARKAVRLSARDSVEWGTPVLHMRSPDGVLFRVDTTATRRAVTASGDASRTTTTAPPTGQAATPPAGVRPLVGAEESGVTRTPTTSTPAGVTPSGGIGGILLGSIAALIVGVLLFRSFSDQPDTEPSGVAADSVPYAPSASPTVAPAAALTAATDSTPTPTEHRAAWARTMADGVGVAATFWNNGASPIDLMWVDFEGREKPYGSIAPRASVELTTGSKNLWVFRQKGVVTGVFILGDRARQTVLSSPNGRNLGLAQFTAMNADAMLGQFLQKSSTTWEETHANGSTPFLFTETARDDSTVTLRDESRDITVRLNVRARLVLLLDATGQERPMYRISTGAVTGFAVSTATYVDGAGALSGRFVKTGAGWVHTRADGSTEVLTERARDEFSVYLTAPDGSELFIDTYLRQVRRLPDKSMAFRIIDVS
ncbi:MAG: CHAT domain-containing protein [Gemmatimonadaceae bacterium]|jgi:hypothetical protein|nr:CHAT domain-containing protein [Gemmatimonadaceae bacterium]